MSIRIPSLNALRVFEAAARHLSLIRASEELFVTQGAVSRQIKQLEESIGVLLFERRNRAIFLTREGELLKNTCQEMLAQLAITLQKLKGNPYDRPLVVSCEPTIAMRWLIPRLSDFHTRYPEIQLHLFTAGGVVDFQGGHIDLAIRRNDFNWGKDCYSEEIGQEKVGPVCVPEQLQDGQIHLEHRRLLHTRTRPDAWARWGGLAQQGVTNHQNLYFEHFYLSLQAATAGLGVAIASAYMIEEELKNGRLIAPYGLLPDGSSYVVLSAEPFAQDKRRLVFLDWLRQEFQKSDEMLASLLAGIEMP
ncbi:LysR substrate-binding domain-containing protein [Iodobacter sp. LRB]|uniref:LysR substrate-binding domain-containing protein n=1 Tax=unclassified Iodobacter TaxID=235634 RepID=UPI000C0FFA17|nr:LysR substrate-binding domain-containing protein [Iodobacter sp. BJB302]PHV01800.1 LysR family transcriptional regulator [Iodobacter sp. BJB302]